MKVNSHQLDATQSLNVVQHCPNVVCPEKNHEMRKVFCEIINAIVLTENRNL